MAHTIALTEVYQVTPVNYNPPQTALIRWYYQITSITGIVTDADAAATFDVALSPLFAAMMTNGAQYRGVLVQRVSPLPILVRQVGNSHPANGSRGTTPAPGQLTGLIHWATDLAKQRGRGRSYLPFPDKSDITPSTAPSIGLLNAYANLAAFVLGPVTVVGGVGTSSTWSLVLTHRAGKSPTPLPTGITAYQVEGAFATQRRRGSFGKPNVPPI